MKCPKCGYNSFEYLDTCKKCSADLTSFKASNKIIPLIIPLSRTVAPTPSSEPSFVPPAAAFEDTHDNFLTDNPAIISSAGTSAAAGGGNDPVFGEFSFGDDLQANAEPASASWDSPAAAAPISIEDPAAGQDLADLFGDAPPFGEEATGTDRK